MNKEYQKPVLLTFKWTVSRGQDTYGYNICSLYADGEKVSSCNGGGYDMQGTALAMYLEREFQAKLLTLKDRAISYTATEDEKGPWLRRNPDEQKHLYGLSYYTHDNTMHLDGGCGQTSMERIAEAAGIELVSTKTGKNSWGYFLHK